MIKALYDYNAPADSNMYLSFSAGDFLHVVSRENDPDWYEACNPLRNERGLVPVKYFEGVGKTVRDSGDSTQSVPSTTHDSGYAEGATPPAHAQAAPRMSTSTGPAMPGHRPSRSLSRVPGGVYGVVSYDFHAERPDELDAKEGEAIIVIAQSNPEWFVAKPITRLGGPGLIPVSFIEIRDMTTGKAVEDPVAAVAKAGIPRVEEWKKMAAEYKNTSIPLGTVSTSGTLEQNMGRLSVSNSQNGYPPTQRSTSGSYQTQQQQNLFAPVRASVPRFVFADDKFHFVVECRLSNGSHWDLSRIYEDFYELQINLINAFPDEAGQVAGKPRILPYMPGPVKFVTDSISEGRRANLDEYLRDLLSLQQHITCSSLVRNFFAPRDGDYELEQSDAELADHARPAEAQPRHSESSQGSYQNAQYQQPGQPRQPSVPNHQYNQSQSSNGTYGHQRAQQSQASANFPSHSDPSVNSLPGPARQMTGTPMGTNGNAPVKVKAWFDRDTCVVIRMAPRGQFTYEELHRKIVERRKLEYKGQDQNDEDLDIEYRDEKDGEYYRLEGDEDLDIAVERNEKLTLAVRAAGS